VVQLAQPLSVEAALGSAVATGNTVRYVVEGTATSGAAGVAEGGTKPESTIGLSTVDEPVRKIATLLGVSEELLEDAPAVQTFVNGELGRYVNLETERQLVRGSAGGAEVQGLLTGRGVPVYQGGTAAGNKAEQLFKAANSMRGSALIEPDWFIVHPTDYEQIRLLKDNQGQLFGGGRSSARTADRRGRLRRRGRSRASPTRSRASRPTSRPLRARARDRRDDGGRERLQPRGDSAGGHQ
jgi:HK97 family phage major capsid protein